MSWLAFSISVFFTSIFSLVAKKIFNDDDELHPNAFASALLLTVAGISTVFYAFTGNHQQDFTNLLVPHIFQILLLNVSLYTVALSLYYRALKKLDLSEVTIIYSLIGIFALVIGILVGVEVFQWSRFFGGCLIILSVAVVMWRKQALRTSKWAWLLVLATAFYGMAVLTDTWLISQGAFSILFFQILSFGVPALLSLFLNPGAPQHFLGMFKPKVYPMVFLNAVFLFVAYFFTYSAYDVGGTASQVNLVLATETIITVVFAGIFLKERENLLLKIVAACLAVAGVVMLR